MQENNYTQATLCVYRRHCHRLEQQKCSKNHFPFEPIPTFHNPTPSMKQAVVSIGPKVDIQDVPIPKPGLGEVLIKVIYAGSNPKDWKISETMPGLGPRNECEDVAGFVQAVGESVTEFRIGDRVGAYLGFGGGGYAEYAVAQAHTAFFLPEKTTFKG
jgi:NADPH2:quinone reductase